MLDRTDELMQGIELGDGIHVLRGGGGRRHWNGIQYRAGLSGRNVGARALSMNVATIPPGGVARAHVHVGFEVMLYILRGRVRHDYGPGLEKVVENEAGDFIFIEPGVPHEVHNLSDTEPVVAVVARSDPAEWENIVPYEREAVSTGKSRPRSEEPQAGGQPGAGEVGPGPTHASWKRRRNN